MVSDEIRKIEKHIGDPKNGLPMDVFLFTSRIMPLVNVDLLIKDEKGRTMLSWRDDKWHGKGWHIPGGIIRYKEKALDRLKKVSETEIGTMVSFDPESIKVTEIISEHKERGHFISILYNCFLPSTFVPENKGLKETEQGFLKWHERAPNNLLKCHEVYRRWL